MSTIEDLQSRTAQVQPTHSVDGELRAQIEHIQLPVPKDMDVFPAPLTVGTFLDTSVMDKIMELFGAHLQAAMAEARNEKRK